MSRAERARRICVWLTEQVRQVAPAGLGTWDRAWELVEQPSIEFLDALASWERTGSPEDKEAVQDAGQAVVAAWKHATDEWERQGRGNAADAAHEAIR